MKQQMGAIVKTPMTRTEACQILNIEDAAAESGDVEPVDHAAIMERFEILYEKNAHENGGSFYVRSKIFFAKEHLMQDWPAELNVSKFDNEGEEDAASEDQETQKEGQESSSDSKSAAADEGDKSSDQKKDD